MKVLVMGGTRMMGLEVVARLLDEGHEVVLFNRGTRAVSFAAPVEEVRGDRDDSTAVGRLASLGVDAVVDLSAYTGHQTSLLLDALADVALFVHCSTGAVYEPQPLMPWHEETPAGPWSLWGAYAEEKHGCEKILRERRRGDTMTAILRLPYVLAPGNYAPREEFVLNRLLDGEEIYLPGDGKAVQQFISASQVGHAFAAAIAADHSPGWHAYNIASHELVSLEGFVDVCADVAGVASRRRAVGGGATGTEDPVFDAANPVFPFPNENYFLDTSAAERDGLTPPRQSVRQMIEEAYEHLLSHPERRQWKRTAAERAVEARLAAASRS